ncbi:hypothetical protein D3C86_2201250 [compost metagenome]
MFLNLKALDNVTLFQNSFRGLINLRRQDFSGYDLQLLSYYTQLIEQSNLLSGQGV